jgi:hypothetical protein
LLEALPSAVSYFLFSERRPKLVQEIDDERDRTNLLNVLFKPEVFQSSIEGSSAPVQTDLRQVALIGEL